MKNIEFLVLRGSIRIFRNDLIKIQGLISELSEDELMHISYCLELAMEEANALVKELQEKK